MKKIIHIAEVSVACVLIGAMAFIVVGACVALIPVRWIIDWGAKRTAEGDKHTS